MHYGISIRIAESSSIQYITIFYNLQFKRATVQNYKTGELETASYRISKTAWLRREEAKQVDNIYQRVHDITGLNMETSEELQVSNYGMGGHYEPHFDFAKVSETDIGAILILQIMYYAQHTIFLNRVNLI